VVGDNWYQDLDRPAPTERAWQVGVLTGKEEATDRAPHADRRLATSRSCRAGCISSLDERWPTKGAESSPPPVVALGPRVWIEVSSNVNGEPTGKADGRAASAVPPPAREVGTFAKVVAAEFGHDSALPSK